MMSNEEWERKMDFLLNQQAKFDVEMYELKAAQARTEKSLDRAAKNISHLAGFIHEGFGLTMNMIEELKESQKLTDEALRKLITRFDRNLSEGHPGLEN